MSDLSSMSDEQLTSMAAQAHLQSLPDDQLQAMATAAAPETKAAPPSTMSDIASSSASGLLKGTGALIGLPGDIDNLTAHVRHWALEKAGIISPETRAKMDASPGTFGVDLGSGPIISALSKGADTISDAIGGKDTHVENFKPSTTLGQYAETISSFLPAAAATVATGGASSLPEIAGGLVKQAVIPGAASETAGQVTKGTALEPYARAAGALAGAAPGMAADYLARMAPSSRLATALSTMNDADFAKVQSLMDEGRALGSPVPMNEAVQHVTNGATSIGDIARVVENSPAGGPIMKAFYADRPAQTDHLATRGFNAIARLPENPDAVAPAVSRAAQNVVASSPKAQNLNSAIDALGPQTTAEQAGNIIRPQLQSVQQGREGMRAALAAHDYQAARAADDLFVPPAPSGVIGKIGSATPRATDPSSWEPNFSFEPEIGTATDVAGAPVDVKPVLDFVDSRLGQVKGDAATALQSARSALLRNGLPDTSVGGLDNARKAIGDQISVATRAGNNNVARELLDVQGQLDYALEQQPLYGQARRNFAAASEPLAPFAEGTAPGAILDKDQFGQNYTMPTERVAPTIERGGPTAADQFLAASQNAPEARQAFERYFSQKILGSATDEVGNINPDRLAAVMQKNSDMLDRFPGIQDKLAAVGQARQGLATVQSSRLGQVAATPDFDQQISILFNPKPLPGSEAQVGNAVRSIAAKDPEAASQLVRLYAERVFNEAQRSITPGLTQFAGPKFSKVLVGNPQQAANFEAAVRALPDGATKWQAFQNGLKIMQAQGWRAPPGSMTTFNTQIADELGAGNGLSEAVSTAASPSKLGSWVSDRAQKYFYRKNTEQMARLFTEGDINDLKNLAQSAPGTRRASAALATAMAPTMGQLPAPAAGQQQQGQSP